MSDNYDYLSYNDIDLKCPTCGSQLSYIPGTSALYCKKCYEEMRDRID